jgi:7-keto-8-aminopelargonate synthetase-like enzyme
VHGKDYLYFGGTNYLGLAHRPELKAAVVDAMDMYGLSSGASRLTSGENELLLGLEEDLARAASCESALVLPAGFVSNQVAVETIADDVDGFVLASYAHASIKSAVRLAHKPIIVDDTIFGANAAQPMRRRLGLAADTRLVFFVEPIEPFTGRVVDLTNILSQMQPQDLLILDEAHSFGVLGRHGRGAHEHYANLPPGRFIRTGTFSKALGTYGGFLLATEEFITNAKKSSSVFKASTSLPPALCAATREALKLIAKDDFALNVTLRHNIEQLTAALEKLNISGFVNDGVPIFYLPYCAGVAKARDLMPQRQIFIPGMSTYFAGFCEVGLRFTIQSGHTSADLEKLVSVCAEAM